jgi:hypothetical protein
MLTVGEAGAWLGFFFGGIGWIIIAVMQPTPEEEAKRMAMVIAAIQGQMNSQSAILRKWKSGLPLVCRDNHVRSHRVPILRERR